MRTLAFGIAAILAPFAGVHAAPSPITIATGPVAGFAFPLGGELCKIYEEATQGKAACSVIPTDGSVDNLNRLRAGEATLAVVQSDVALEALSASGQFAGKQPYAGLRSLLGFYSEPLTILVRDGAVKTVDDLKGKKVVTGEPHASDQLFPDFLEGLGWSKADLGGVVEMVRGDQIPALCGGNVAAVSLAVAHPNGFVRQALAACPVAILNLAGAGIDGVVTSHPAYAAAHLDMRVYGATGTVESFGPRAVLVGNVKLDEDVVARMLDAVFTHLDELKKAHPAFGALDRDSIAASAGLSAERHPAAARYLTAHHIMDGPSGAQ